MDNISLFSFHKTKRYFCAKTAATTIHLPWTSMGYYTAPERGHYTVTK